MKYHIWRQFDHEPYTRYGCTLEQADTPDGYRMVDSDPSVASMDFLHTLADHLRQPIGVQSAAVDGDGVSHFMHTRGPGEVGHFEAAVRSIPGAYLCAVGRG